MPRNIHHANLQARVGDDLWTPVNAELLELFERIKREYGTWTDMGWTGRCSQRWLRHVMAEEHKDIAYTTLDEFLNNLGWDGWVQKLEWYSSSELVEMGIWKEQPMPPPHPKSELTLAVEEIRRKREAGEPPNK
jgi:hypothetical protein